MSLINFTKQLSAAKKRSWLHEGSACHQSRYCRCSVTTASIFCLTMSCSGTDDKTLGKITENFTAILFIAVNRWVSCDVTTSITQLNTVIRKRCSAFVKRVFSQLIKMTYTLLFCHTYVLQLGINTPQTADSCCFIYGVCKVVAVINQTQHRMRSSNKAQLSQVFWQ